MADKPLALVTGGAQGIGLACAEALAELGAQIIVADVNSEGLDEAVAKLANGAVGIHCDMADPEQIEKMFAQIASEHRPLSMLVNNAGIAAPGDFLETTLEQFKQVIECSRARLD